MDKKYLTAPCGLDCFNCDLLEGNLPEERRVRIAEYRNISPDRVICLGCRTEKGKCLYADYDCATWACAEKKGVTYCFECDEFPCSLLAPTAKGAYFPHNMKVYSLCRMKLNGIDTWIEESSDIRKRYFEGDFIVGQGPIIKMASDD